jgi:hypothetical protein
MSKILAAHQPNFLPYLGFFDKYQACDVFVIRDEVQFTKSDFHHRNRIRVNGNSAEPKDSWLTVPVEDLNDYIMHIPIKKHVMKKDKTWNEDMLHQLSVQYKNTPFFHQYFGDIQNIMDNSDPQLVSLNMKLIRYLLNTFGLGEDKLVMASDLKLKTPHYVPGSSDPSEDLAIQCQLLGADVYLSGAGGKNYLDLEPFRKRGIEVRFQEYHHPKYRQAFNGFLPNLCALDALFCIGSFPREDTQLREINSGLEDASLRVEQREAFANAS